MSGAFIADRVPQIPSLFAGKTAEEIAKLPAFTMECGTEDTLVMERNDTLDRQMSASSVAHQYIRRSGRHDWAFWHACLPKALKFASAHFTSSEGN